jgi:hypothetical protein
VGVLHRFTEPVFATVTLQTCIGLYSDRISRGAPAVPTEIFRPFSPVPPGISTRPRPLPSTSSAVRYPSALVGLETVSGTRSLHDKGKRFGVGTTCLHHWVIVDLEDARSGLLLNAKTVAAAPQSHARAAHVPKRVVLRVAGQVKVLEGPETL